MIKTPLALLAVLLSGTLFGEPPGEPPRETRHRVLIAAVDADGAALAAQIRREMDVRGLLGPTTDQPNQTALFEIVVEPVPATVSPAALEKQWRQWEKRADVDALVLLGSRFAHLVTQPEQQLTKPVFSAMGGNAALLGVGYNDLGRSGKARLALAVGAPRLERDLRTFSTMVGFDKVQILVDASWTQQEPKLREAIQRTGQKLGIETQVVPVDGTDPPQLDPTQRAVYSALLPHLSRAQRQNLHLKLAAEGYAVFSGYGSEDVTAGAFAAALVSPQERTVRRLADHLEDWRSGSLPEDLPAYVAAREQPRLNGQTAAKLGLKRDERWFLQADVLHPDTLETGTPLTLNEAVSAALNHNYDVAAAEQQVIQAKAGRRIGQSALLPQIEASASWQQNDADNAQVAAGFQAEEQTNFSVQARQVLWDVTTFNQSRSAALEQDLSKAGYDATTRNVINEVAAAYLNVLSQKALHEINIENLKLTRSHLQTAQSRLSLGAAGREEVFRWEVQEAQNLSSMHDSRSAYETARNELTRLLGADDTQWIVGETNPWKNTLFYQTRWTEQLKQGVSAALQTRLTQIAAEQSPDLEQQALQRKLAGVAYDTSLKSLFMPSISLSAAYQDVLDQQFAGENGGLFGANTEGTWTVSLAASYQVFNGGRRFHQLAQNRARVREGDLLLAARRDQVATSVANNLAQVQANWRKIAPAERAAQRATQSLAIVRGKYEQGTASLLDLLEAQEQALAGSRQSALAHYAYLRALFQLQAAVNDFPILQNNPSAPAWLDPAGPDSQKTGPVNHLQGATP
ncbi:TolC family protein [Acanthopleuribacter pedis]|uniref:TolC family protein n=1 Tax=Acanthopleuribacter pedis TaxID=442870 RepID=A0A8J7QDB9_9BACT|nr:TolC family protein [Acanthopleuribacter pedis]MBO1321694.1 TolC family protein [Acanthopleuribacter pedis]